MKTEKLALIFACALAMSTFAGTALAGEWNKATGDVAAKQHGRSDCLFNGQDQPDESYPGAGDGEGPADTGGYDDPLWGSTPAGAHSGGNTVVQAGGQLTASGAGYVGQGTACNGHLNPINTD
jgi:hypothetical protein